MSKKLVLSDEVVVVADSLVVDNADVVVAEVTADEAQTGEVDKYAGLMLTADDMLAESAIPGYTVGQLLDMSPGEFWAVVGLYRSTKDEGKIAELTQKRDTAITNATKDMPIEYHAAFADSIGKIFNKELTELGKGDDNARLLGKYFTTGNIVGSKSTRQGAKVNWLEKGFTTMLHVDNAKNAYLFTLASNLKKGGLPEGTKFENDSDVVIFKVRGGHVGNTETDEDNMVYRQISPEGIGFEYRGTVQPPMPHSPSGINITVQRFLKEQGDNFRVDGWQSLAIPRFNGDYTVPFMK